MFSEKKLLAFFTILSLLVFAGCEKDEPDPPEQPVFDAHIIRIPEPQIGNPTSFISGEIITVIYEAAGRSLQMAPKVYIQAAYNDWALSNRVLMTKGSGPGQWTISYMVPQAAFNISIAFNDNQSNTTWDNQNGTNWNFTVTPGPAPADVGDPPPLSSNASRAHVMMQGFYWDCPNGWYTTMTSKAAELRNMRDGQGIDRMWFPPPSKGFSGSFSMGYDPYDYYDVGQYLQHGTTATHFGTQEQLIAATTAYRSHGIACLADAVLNHRSGGAGEVNLNTGENSWTDYSVVASGKCAWRYNGFHPSTFETMDEGRFGDMADVCYETGNAPGTARYDIIEWGNWLMDNNNAGFDGGWRFDFIKGYHPSMVAEFRKGTNNSFGIIECWDNMKNIESFVKYSGNTSAFDFPTYYTMIASIGAGGWLSDLVSQEHSFAAKNPAKAVTFVANHDTDELTANRMLAYAFILTYQGYPCIFWKDYFDRGLAELGGQEGNGIKALVWARGALAGGTFQVENLKADNQTLLSYGTTQGTADTPGFVVFINTSASVQAAVVTTTNSYLQGKTLQSHAWYSYVNGANVKPADAACDATGHLSVEVPPKGYAVYSVPLP